MTVSFPFTGSITPLVFVSWIPLLFIENNVTLKKYRSSKVFIHALIVFVLYNIGTTWWIWYADEGGAIFAFSLNGLIMAFVFFLFHLLKKRFAGKTGYFFLPIFWIAFEYLHYNWELSYPWLNLGNVFSITPSFVQWYSYIGVLGGTLWILSINILIFFLLQNKYLKGVEFKLQKRSIILVSGLFFLPIIFSLATYYSYTEKVNPVEIVAIQPNIDPYNEKFSDDAGNQKNLLDKICDLADKSISNNTKFVLAPETSIWEEFNESNIENYPFYSFLFERKSNWKDAELFIGASTFLLFENKNSSASMKDEGGPGFYERYNSSLLLNNKNQSKIIHKSKLVLGVEKVPFISYIPWLEDLVINLDGASGTLGIEKEPRVLTSNNLTFAPSICYESIYGDFISQQVSKGAEVIFIITNDGWWGDTPGYRQHASFASLRAIENRRSVARSANTGISCFVNQRGDVLDQTKWWVSSAIRGELNTNKEMTFYTKHGDWLGKLFLYLSFSLIFYEFIKRISAVFSTTK